MFYITNYVYYGFVVNKSDPEYSILCDHEVYEDLDILKPNDTDYILLGLKLSEISEDDEDKHNLIIPDDLEKRANEYRVKFKFLLPDLFNFIERDFSFIHAQILW